MVRTHHGSPFNHLITSKLDNLFAFYFATVFSRVSSTVLFCSLSTNPDNLVRTIKTDSRTEISENHAEPFVFEPDRQPDK